MKRLTFFLFTLFFSIEGFSQNDVSIGLSYKMNLQRQNDNADAFILHNAKVDVSSGRIFRWDTSHPSFGTRGMFFNYSTGIHFFADGVQTFANATFSPTTRLFIGNNGRVGIGTDNPSAKLEVNGGPAGSEIAIRVGGDVLLNSGGSLFFDGNYNYSTGSYIKPSAVNTQGFFTSGVQRLLITPNGNVGIGNANPVFRLDVAGPINATSLNVNGQPFIGSKWLSSGSDIYFTSGKVGIGTPLTNNPNNYSLAVNGKIGTKDVQIEGMSTTWPDYVFQPTYQLPSLTEVEQYIKENQHLPEVPSAENVAQKGYSMSELDVVLLKKVEELTLYLIEQQKQIDELKKKLEESKRQMN